MKVKIAPESLARYIDQTNLRPEATEEEMRRFLDEARKYGFFGVAVMPLWIPLSAKILKGSVTRIVAAIGYPLGTIPTLLKVQEAKWAIENGNSDTELDVVMNVSLLKSGRLGATRDDVSAVVKAADGRPTKVIIEVPLLTREETLIACRISEKAGARFVKTSTGFRGLYNWRPTSVDDVRLIRSAVGERLKIKAAGGIETLDQVLAMIEAGASRVGTSSGVHIVETSKKLKEL